jgi:hypothetical protein
MAKNLYILSAYDHNGFNTEGSQSSSKYVTLMPQNFKFESDVMTNNDQYFWQPPKSAK